MMKKIKKERITLLGLMKYRKFYWFLAIILGILTISSSIGLLSTSGWFITAAGIAGLLSIEINYVIVSGLIRTFALTRTAGRYAGDLVSHNAVLHLLKNLRVRIFHFLALYRSKLHHVGVHSVTVMHRLVVDIDRLNLFPLKFILPWIFSTIIIIFVLFFISLLSLQLFLSMIPGILLAWLIVPCFSLIKGVQLAKDEVILSENCKQQFVQSLSLLTSLLIWKTWKIQQDKMNRLDAERLHKSLTKQKLISLITMLQNLALALSLIGCLWEGVYLIRGNQLTVSWLLGITLGIMGLVECLSPLAGNFVSLGLSIYSKKRINELIDYQQTPIEHNQQEPNSIQSLELINVSARIPNALNGPSGVSFKLHTSDILCIRGPSGVGKTTLLDLIAREIHESEGKIFLNHQPIDGWNLKNTIGYLQQKIDIFDFTLAQNLRIGKNDATDEELWQVLELVCLADWAKNRVGLNTPLGEYGAEVSGGQARRIALARLLLANRLLLLLDEPFAGLDQKNVELLYQRLKEHAQNRIIIIVSHHDLSAYGCQEYQLTY